MKLSKESWHYKLFMKWRSLKFDKDWIPYRYDGGLSLCCYVKAVFLFAMPRIIFQSMITRLSVLNIFIFLVIYGELNSSLFLKIMIVISGGLLALMFAAIIIVITGFTMQFLTESQTSTNIIRPYFQAKKDKICPHIDFVD